MRRYLLVSSLVGALLLAPSVSYAQANEAEAKVHYQKGVDLYNDGAYTAALAELEKAYALSPHYRVLYSLALVRGQLSDFVGALLGFQDYMAAAVDESPARKAEVKERIEALQQKVASVTIKVNIDDAEVYVDDQLKGTSPFPQAVLLNPGKHVFYAKKGTTKTEPKTISVGAGSHRIALELDAGNAAGPSPLKIETTAPTRSSETGTPWVTIGIITTGAFVVGTAVTGLLTLSARSDLETKQKAPNNIGDLDSASSKVSTMALVTDILAGAAIVAGALTAYAVITKKPVATTTTASKTWLTAGPTSLGFGGRF